MCQIHGLREIHNWKNVTEIDFVLIKKNTNGFYEMQRQFLGSFNMHKWLQI